MKSSPFSLTDRCILVTGASSGIGRAAAIMASQMGAKVILSGRDEARLAECMASLTGEGHLSLPLDLLNEDAIQEYAKVIAEIDGMVFAAGVAEVIPFRMVSSTHVNRVMQLNFNAPVYLTQALLKRKKIKNSASLVYISAIADHVAPPGSAIYSASKAALNAFVRSIALEISKFKMRANCVSPGYVKTPMMERLASSTSVDEMVGLAPLGIIQPEEVAASIVYLLSDASRWATRSTLVIDAGLTLPIRR
jgi:NAD(P)-dependent dehydrogenase (short-subunit alcohol dehydrogenase family)